MNFPIDYLYRLVDRGGAGLSCDARGVTLGSAELARMHLGEGRVRRCEVRSASALGQILKAAYGPQPDAVVQRLHRGMRRTAAWLEAGHLCQAGVEAVMLRVPDLTPNAVAKLTELADLEKRGQPWEDEPRLPAGQAGGGQWTTGGGGGGSTAPVKTPKPIAQRIAPLAPARRPPPVQSADPAPLLDDGVYRPGRDDPRVIQIGGPPEETGDDPQYRSNGPPEDRPPIEVATLQEMFPGLKDHPFATAVMAPFDHFIGFSTLADQVGRTASALMYQSLQAETKAIDPHYNDQGFFPEGGFASLSQADRTSLLDKVLLDRAAAYYKFRGDPSKLQIETLRFLRTTVDRYYAHAEAESKAGRLEAKVSPEIAIGNYVDAFTRRDIQSLFDRLGIKYGPGQNVLINNRDHDTTQPEKPYRIPDARIGDVSFDWTLRMKNGTDPQIRGFFAADSKPKGVVIIRPSQLYARGAYYIPRPPDTYRK